MSTLEDRCLLLSSTSLKVMWPSLHRIVRTLHAKAKSLLVHEQAMLVFCQSDTANAVGATCHCMHRVILQRFLTAVVCWLKPTSLAVLEQCWWLCRMEAPS